MPRRTPVLLRPPLDAQTQKQASEGSRSLSEGWRLSSLSTHSVPSQLEHFDPQKYNRQAVHSFAPLVQWSPRTGAQWSGAARPVEHYPPLKPPPPPVDTTSREPNTPADLNRSRRNGDAMADILKGLAKTASSPSLPASRSVSRLSVPPLAIAKSPAPRANPEERFARHLEQRRQELHDLSELSRARARATGRAAWEARERGEGVEEGGTIVLEAAAAPAGQPFAQPRPSVASMASDAMPSLPSVARPTSQAHATATGGGVEPTTAPAPAPSSSAPQVRSGASAAGSGSASLHRFERARPSGRRRRSPQSGRRGRSPPSGTSSPLHLPKSSASTNLLPSLVRGWERPQGVLKESETGTGCCRRARRLAATACTPWLKPVLSDAESCFALCVVCALCVVQRRLPGVRESADVFDKKHNQLSGLASQLYGDLGTKSLSRSSENPLRREASATRLCCAIQQHSRPQRVPPYSVCALSAPPSCSSRGPLTSLSREFACVQMATPPTSPSTSYLRTSWRRSPAIGSDCASGRRPPSKRSKERYIDARGRSPTCSDRLNAGTGSHTETLGPAPRPLTVGWWVQMWHARISHTMSA